MRDARLDIADAQESPGIGAEAGPRRARLERLAWVAITAACVCAAIVVALFAFGILHVREPPAAQQITRFSIQPPSGVLGTGAPKISPDGPQLVFEAAVPGQASVLWLRSLDSRTARSLPGTEGASSPFWSPDSRFVGFFAVGMLKKVDLSGGPALDLCAAPNEYGGPWSSEGVIVFAPTANGPLQRVPESGGTPVPVTTLVKGQEVAHRWPQWLDGRRLIYTSVADESQQPTIRVASLDSPVSEPLVASAGGAVYVSPTLCCTCATRRCSSSHSMRRGGNSVESRRRLPKGLKPAGFPPRTPAYWSMAPRHPKSGAVSCGSIGIARSLP